MLLASRAAGMTVNCFTRMSAEGTFLLFWLAGIFFSFFFRWQTPCMMDGTTFLQLIPQGQTLRLPHYTFTTDIREDYASPTHHNGCLPMWVSRKFSRGSQQKPLFISESAASLPRQPCISAIMSPVDTWSEPDDVADDSLGSIGNSAALMCYVNYWAGSFALLYDCDVWLRKAVN